MRASGVHINNIRGTISDEASLMEFLSSETIAAAGRFCVGDEDGAIADLFSSD